MVNITDVRQILQFAIDAEIKVFLDGGWGVDALLGHQSRSHNDIDIFVEKKDYQNFIEIIQANGFYEIKMEYTTLNHTVWEDAKNRIIDLHCFEYTGKGEILYEGDCFPLEIFSGKGKIEEIEVSCIEPYSQVMFHLGYEFDENDVHDVKLLCETFHIEVPNEYRSRQIPICRDDDKERGSAGINLSAHKNCVGGSKEKGFSETEEKLRRNNSLKVRN